MQSASGVTVFIKEFFVQGGQVVGSQDLTKKFNFFAGGSTFSRGLGSQAQFTISKRRDRNNNGQSCVIINKRAPFERQI